MKLATNISIIFFDNIYNKHMIKNNNNFSLIKNKYFQLFNNLNLLNKHNNIKKLINYKYINNENFSYNIIKYISNYNTDYYINKLLSIYDINHTNNFILNEFIIIMTNFDKIIIDFKTPITNVNNVYYFIIFSNKNNDIKLINILNRYEKKIYRIFIIPKAFVSLYTTIDINKKKININILFNFKHIKNLYFENNNIDYTSFDKIKY